MGICMAVGVYVWRDDVYAYMAEWWVCMVGGVYAWGDGVYAWQDGWYMHGGV